MRRFVIVLSVCMLVLFAVVTVQAQDSLAIVSLDVTENGTLIFLAGYNNNLSIYQINIDGNNFTRLSPGRGDQVTMVDNNTIAYIGYLQSPGRSPDNRLMVGSVSFFTEQVEDLVRLDNCTIAVSTLLSNNIVVIDLCIGGSSVDWIKPIFTAMPVSDVHSLSANGSRLAWVADFSDGIEQVCYATGGNWSPQCWIYNQSFNIGNVSHVLPSSNGSALYFLARNFEQGDNGLYSLSVFGGDVSVVIEGITSYQEYILLDDGMITYQEGGGSFLRRFNHQGGVWDIANLHEVLPGFTRFSKFDVQGNVVAFVASGNNDPRGDALCLIHLDGSNLKCLVASNTPLPG